MPISTCPTCKRQLKVYSSCDEIGGVCTNSYEPCPDCPPPDELRELCKRFIQEHQIKTPERVYFILEDDMEIFIQRICEIIGYHPEDGRKP